MSRPEPTDWDRRQHAVLSRVGVIRYTLLRGLPVVSVSVFTLFSALDYLQNYGLSVVEPFWETYLAIARPWIPGSLLVGVVGTLAYVVQLRVALEQADNS